MYEDLIATIALAMGVSWASGINLYAAIFMLGFLGSNGQMDLPAGLEVLESPAVMGAAGLMYLIEFFTDKIPGVDTGWDGLHTFIRIPAGAILAAAAVGDVTPAWQITAGILGGGMATASHAAKAGGRILINTSPEPVTNWTASIGEDIAVLGGVWAALTHPWVFLVLMVLWLILLIWLLPKIWVGIKKAFRFLNRLFGGEPGQSESTPSLNQGPISHPPNPTLSNQKDQ